MCRRVVHRLLVSPEREKRVRAFEPAPAKRGRAIRAILWTLHLGFAFGFGLGFQAGGAQRRFCFAEDAPPQSATER